MIRTHKVRGHFDHRLATVLSLSTALLAGAAAQADQELRTGTQSNTLQTGTQSTTLQTGTQSTTLQTGTQSTLLQSGTQSTTIQGGTAAAIIQGGVQQETGPTNILFILDCSNSMKEKLSGQIKLELAKRVLQDAMQRIPGDINVGLRVFGQSITPDIGLDCEQTALLVPLGTGNRGSIIRRLTELRAAGMTPLEFALRAAATDDFRDVQGRKIIILITDGIDTCGGNPCAFIAILPRYGIKIKCDVVGVDIHRSEHNQLDCIAKTSGGKYYDANTAGKLIDSISESVDKAISGRVLTPSEKSKNTETPPELIPLHATPDRP
jgi:hypothetical protein